ncbi:hypothetical protein [Tomitella gaofuii]|uniref:hypothetical protein n=1 Tax=Tomitella gaofuii TaxID=2760083 RepID=UPI0015FA3C29|nr:hypothetical protein [Tomitella gaofuii]
MTRADVCARCGHARVLHETVPTDHRFKSPRKKDRAPEPPIGRDELRAIIRAEVRAELARARPEMVTTNEYHVPEPVLSRDQAVRLAQAPQPGESAADAEIRRRLEGSAQVAEIIARAQRGDR